MPIYAYKCERCGEVLEVLQKLGSGAPACPKQTPFVEHKMVKQLTAPGGFDLRGGGYYQSDFKGP